MSLVLLFPPSLGRLKATARAQLLAETLTRWLSQDVEVEVADTYSELEERVLGCDVDLAWAPPSVCARVEGDAPAIFKSVRNGRDQYRAALVGRAKNTPTLDGLRGTRAAWVDPLSTGGHLLAVSLLASKGQDAGSLFTDQRFYGSYQGALLAVLGGDADVSAIYTHGDDETAARETLVVHVGASEVELAPFAYTDPSPNDGLIITSKPSNVSPLIDDLAHVTDGSRGPTLLLEIFEADTLVRAKAGDYAVVARALA